MKTNYCFAFLLLALHSSAQMLKKPGFVVLKNKKIIYGQINVHNWQESPKAILFQPFDQPVSATYGLSDLISFQIDGGDQYVSAIISQDKDFVADTLNFENVRPCGNQGTIVDTAFLRTLVKGDFLSLFEFRDHYGVHFYLRIESTGEFKQLHQDGYVIKKGVVVASSIVSIELNEIAVNINQQEKLFPLINGAEYTAKSIMPVIEKINELMGKKLHIETFKPHLKSVFWHAGITHGITGVTFHTMSGINDKGVIVSQSGYINRVSLGADITDNMIAFRIDCSLMKEKLRMYYVNEKDFYSIDLLNITPELSLQFKPINEEKFQAFINGGVVFPITISSKQKNTNTSAWYKLEFNANGMDACPFLSGSIRLFYNWEISVAGYYSGLIPIRNVNALLEPNVRYLRFTYHFK